MTKHNQTNYNGLEIRQSGASEFNCQLYVIGAVNCVWWTALAARHKVGSKAVKVVFGRRMAGVREGRSRIGTHNAWQKATIYRPPLTQHTFRLITPNEDPPGLLHVQWFLESRPAILITRYHILSIKHYLLTEIPAKNPTNGLISRETHRMKFNLHLKLNKICQFCVWRSLRDCAALYHIANKI